MSRDSLPCVFLLRDTRLSLQPYDGQDSAVESDEVDRLWRQLIRGPAVKPMTKRKRLPIATTSVPDGNADDATSRADAIRPDGKSTSAPRKRKATTAASTADERGNATGDARAKRLQTRNARKSAR